jgi:hypothetical protein
VVAKRRRATTPGIPRDAIRPLRAVELADRDVADVIAWFGRLRYPSYKLVAEHGITPLLPSPSSGYAG